MLRLLRAGLLLLVLAILTGIFVDGIRSESVDMAHHYALVVRLTEFQNGPFPADPSLGEMNTYPRLSHQMAALAGTWFGSPLMGMQVLAVLAQVGLWGGLMWLVATLPRRIAAVAAVVIIALLALNHYRWGLPLHGDELIKSFFYPQIVGQALAVAMVLASMYLERQGVAPWLRYAVLIPAVYVLAGVHLLPALILLMLMGWMVVTDSLVLWRARQPGLLAHGAAGAGLLLCALGALISHPGFATMRDISRNNGWIELAYFNAAVMPWLCVLLAAAAVGMLAAWQRRRDDHAWLPLKFVALYSLAVCGLALLQCVSLKLGFASEYALRKYAYALNTVALLELAVLPGLLLFRRRQADPGRDWPARLQYCLLPALLTTVACLAVAWQPARFQTSALVAVEQSVLALKERLGPAGPHKDDYMMGVGDLPGVIEYMYSIAGLHASRMENSNAASLLFEHRIENWSTVARLITAENGRYDVVPACRVGAGHNGLVALDGACLRRYGASSPYIDFTDANKFLSCVLTGFSGQEQGGAWTYVREAQIRCPRLKVHGKAPRHLELKALAFRADLSRQRVTLSADGLPPQQAVYAGSQHQIVTLPLRDTGDDEVEIRLDMPDAVSPVALGLGPDSRVLGLFVRGVTFRD
ncbi:MULTISPECIES: hypothetical protein [unclassified Duganella]|uniref:hypothetical protein n=1 Tax=unclassified Duganella TaxID=2636909 RepID=UPI000B7E6453|nr:MULTISPECIES: hypothetical protein [unclassified Duganella]